MSSGRGHRRERPQTGLALGLAGLGLLLLSFFVYVLLRPVYWKLYAEVIHSYAPDPIGSSTDEGDVELALFRNRKAGPLSMFDNAQAGDNSSEVLDLSSLTAEELEHLKQKAREKQWEEEWWQQYVKSEVLRKDKELLRRKQDERRTIAEYNHTLTREVVQGLAQDGYLMVTWANSQLAAFALTWVHHVQAANISAYIVGALDSDMLMGLAKRRINTFVMQGGPPTLDFSVGTKNFAMMGRKKISLIATFLRFGVQVIVSDVDVMWLRNPIPFFQRFPAADILTSSDHLGSTVRSGEQLERYPEAGGAFNIGIQLFRNRSLAFVDEWIQVLEADKKLILWDQNVFNELVRRGQKSLPDDPDHYFLGANGKLKVGVLPVASFCSGHTYFTQGMPETLGVQPYAVHTTWQYGGVDGKRHRLREGLLWIDDLSYYRPAGGLLVFEPDIPQQLIARAGPNTGKSEVANVVGHFELVNYQLKQIRTASAIASILGRTLVLPPIWCGQDRWWAPHAGTIPTSNFTLPFVCPSDHVLDLEGGMAAKLPEAEYGPPINFREHSLLNHSLMPEASKASMVYVSTCKKGTMGCADGSNPGTLEQNKLTIQENMDSERIKMALSSVSSMMIIKFTSVVNAFSNFTNPVDFQKFYKRTMHFGSVWCCVDAQPGHIHYDFWWDLPGHTDKFGRTWDKWEPRTGP